MILAAGTAFFSGFDRRALTILGTCRHSTEANQNNYFATCVVLHNAAVITVTCLLQTVTRVRRLHQMNITGASMCMAESLCGW
jgi:hypothetical protein